MFTVLYNVHKLGMWTQGDLPFHRARYKDISALIICFKYIIIYPHIHTHLTAQSWLWLWWIFKVDYHLEPFNLVSLLIITVNQRTWYSRNPHDKARTCKSPYRHSSVT